MIVSDDAGLRQLLSETRTIALIGASDKPERDSNRVMGFLIDQGYTLYPVNPGLAGQEIHGRTVHATLADIGAPVDLVDIFRSSDAAGDAVDEAIAAKARGVWMQLGVINEVAAQRASAAGLKVVMDRCPKIEIPRLGLLHG